MRRRDARDTRKGLAAIMGEIIDQPYYNPETGRGIDCWQVVTHLCRERSVPVPPWPEGWTEENYRERWYRMREEDPARLREMELEFLEGLGTVVDPSRMIAGDVLVLEDDAGACFPAVYCGHNRAVAAFKSGVRPFGTAGVTPLLVVRIP